MKKTRLFFVLSWCLIGISGATDAFGTGTPALAADSSHRALYEIPLSAPSVLGLTLLKSTFADAAKKLGPAKQYRESSDMESPVDVCYRSKNEKANITLDLDSYYTGGWTRLSGYSLEYGLPMKNAPCAKSSLITANMKVLHGHIWLGMTKREVTEVLGTPYVRNVGKSKKPSKNTDPNSWDYSVKWKIPFSKAKNEKMKKAYGADWTAKDAYYDAWTNVTLTFKNSKLVDIYVDHGVSD